MLAALVALVLPLSLAVPGTAPVPGPAVTSALWGWPLASTAPVVLAGFAPPEHRWLPGHRGVDLAAAPGAAVLSPSDGVVTFAGPVGGVPVVVVRAPSGLRSSLQPVTAAVTVGAAVRRGQQIGVIATDTATDTATNTATEAMHCSGCLHWGVLTSRGHGVSYRDPVALVHPLRVVLLPLR